MSRRRFRSSPLIPALQQLRGFQDLANPIQSPSHATMYPAYVRGLAYLRIGGGTRAANEFQRIIDHRNIVANCPLGALARLELGLSHVEDGRQSPIFREGKAEYAKLN